MLTIYTTTPYLHMNLVLNGLTTMNKLPNFELADAAKSLSDHPVDYLDATNFEAVNYFQLKSSFLTDPLPSNEHLHLYFRSNPYSVKQF